MNASSKTVIRAVLNLGVGYDSDIDHVRDVINQVGEDMQDNFTGQGIRPMKKTLTENNEFD